MPDLVKRFLLDGLPANDNPDTEMEAP